MSSNLILSHFLRALRLSTCIHLFGTAMGFLVGVLLARGLGVTHYGLYGSAMAAASFGATVSAGGLQLHATLEIAANQARGAHEASARLIYWSIYKVLICGVIIGIIVGYYVFCVSRATPMLAFWAAIITFLMAVLGIVGAIVRGTGAVILGQAMDIAIRPTFQSLLLSAAIIVLAEIDPALALALSSAAIILTLPFGWRVIFCLLDRDRISHITYAERREWLRSSSTMGLTTVIRSAETFAPLILIGMFSTMQEAGLIRVATATMLLPNIPANIITIMVPAVVSSLYARHELVQLQHIARIACIATLLPTLVLACILWIFGERLIDVFFGNDYSAAWAAMSVLTGASTISAISGISISILHASGNEAVVTRAFGLSLIIVITGTLLEATDRGALGVAFAVLVGTIIRTGFLIASVWRLVRIDPTFLMILRKNTEI